MVVSVVIHDFEKERMLGVIRKYQKEVKSVRALATWAGYNPNRTRFIIDQLVDEGKVRKVVAKQFNEKYIRYRYEVIEK